MMNFCGTFAVYVTFRKGTLVISTGSIHSGEFDEMGDATDGGSSDGGMFHHRCLYNEKCECAPEVAA